MKCLETDSALSGSPYFPRKCPTDDIFTRVRLYRKYLPKNMWLSFMIFTCRVILMDCLDRHGHCARKVVVVFFRDIYIYITIAKFRTIYCISISKFYVFGSHFDVEPLLQRLRRFISYIISQTNSPIMYQYVSCQLQVHQF